MGFLAATAVAAWELSSTRPLAAHSPTAQALDLLFFQGDTLAICANPLEAYLEQGRGRPDEFFPGCMSTGCWRDYQALRQIDEERLYLHPLQSCCDADPQFPGGLDSLRAFVYRHLNWTAVPHPDTGSAVIPIVEIDTTGKARVQRIFRTSRPDTEAEIRWVFEQLPPWQVGYHKGKKTTFSFGFPIPLSDSLRRLHTQ